MVSRTHAADIGAGYGIGTVLSADRIPAEAPMTGAGMTSTIES